MFCKYILSFSAICRDLFLTHFWQNYYERLFWIMDIVLITQFSLNCKDSTTYFSKLKLYIASKFFAIEFDVGSDLNVFCYVKIKIN